VYNQNLGQPVLAQDGVWHELLLHLELNTPGSADGVIEMWIDGVQRMSHAGVNLRGSYTDYGWNTMMMRGWDGDIPAGGYQQDFDSIVASGSSLQISTGPPANVRGIRWIVCGDGRLDSPAETCDGNLLGGATCQSVGFAGGGMLGCSFDCRSYDTSQCQSGN
jgi:hypothetical protein